MLKYKASKHDKMLWKVSEDEYYLIIQQNKDFSSLFVEKVENSYSKWAKISLIENQGSKNVWDAHTFIESTGTQSNIMSQWRLIQFVTETNLRGIK